MMAEGRDTGRFDDVTYTGLVVLVLRKSKYSTVTSNSYYGRKICRTSRIAHRVGVFVYSQVRWRHILILGSVSFSLLAAFSSTRRCRRLVSRRVDSVIRNDDC